MALIKCPDCHSEVSDAAPACLKCGRPMASAPTPSKRITPSSNPVTINSKEQTKPAKVVALVVLFIIVVSAINYALQHKKNAPSSTAADPSTTARKPGSASRLPSQAQQQSQSIRVNEDVHRLSGATENSERLTAQSSIAVNNNGLGFEPVVACHFLSSNVMFTKGGDYTPMWDDTLDDYSCGTTYFQLGPASGDGLANNISMYGRGTSKVVERVNVLLNVNDASTFDKANVAFRSAASDLFTAALHKDLDEQIETALKTSAAGTWMVGSYKVELLRDDWPTGKGYSLNFVIRDPAFNMGF